MKIESFCKKWALLFFLLILFGCNSSSGGSGSQDGRDTESPAKPAAISISDALPDKVTINWPASSDNVGVARYRIYRNGARIAETAVTSYTDASITSSGRYCYTVSAVDSVGNESVQSAETCADVPALDTEAPSVPSGVSASTESGTGAAISWTASTDNVGVSGYKIFRDGSYLASASTISYSDSGVSSTEKHFYNISAIDSAGNESAQSAAVFINKNPGKVLWKYETGGEINTDPAIATDGTVYVSSSDGFLYALNPNGTLKWKYDVDGFFYDQNSPSVGKDGIVYIGSSEYLYAINGDGILKWKYQTNIRTCPAIGLDGTVYFDGHEGTNNYFYAINPDGSLKWKYNTSKYSGFGSPSIGFDGTIYGAQAFNPDGTVKWDFSVSESYNLSSPAISADGNILVGGVNYLYNHNTDGSVKWKISSNPLARASRSEDAVTAGFFYAPVIGIDGMIYASSYNPDNEYYLNAISPEGVVRWSHRFEDSLDHRPNPAPLIGADGRIYFQSKNGYLYCFDQNGGVEWKTLTNGSISSPAISGDGIVYIGSSDHSLYAVDSGSLGLADSSYPKVHRDNMNSGSSMISRNDNTAPSIPSNIIIKPSFVNPAWLDLTWDASSDDIGTASGYKIYRNGIFIGLKGLGFTDKDLINASTSNCYKISAIDAAGNESELSPEICSDAPAPSEGVAVKWKYKTGGREIKKIVLGSNGTIYASVSDTYSTYAIDKNGLLKWHQPIYGYFASISDDNTMYLPVGSLVAYDSEGNSKWSKIPHVLNAQPAIGRDGTVYASDEQYFFALSPDGNLKWKTAAASKVDTSSAISSDGTIYTLSASGSLLHAISPEGSVKWNYDNVLPFKGSPAIGGDGTVYIAGGNTDLLAIKPDGVLKFKIPGLLGTRLLVGLYGIIYAGSADGRNLQAINSDGTFKWSLSFAGNDHTTAPVQGADGMIYIAPGDGYLYAIKPDGTQKWKLNIGAYSPAPGSPSIDTDGTLYLGVTYPNTVEAYVYAIQTSSMGLANSSWPSIYRDNQNTCRVP